jgi:hypothetical protein
MLADKELELGDEFGVATKSDVELDPLFERRQPELLEPPPFELHERVELEVDEGVAAPEPERLAEQLGGRLELAVRARLDRFPDEVLEAVRVHSIGLDLEDVAGRAVHDQLTVSARE